MKKDTLLDKIKENVNKFNNLSFTGKCDVISFVLLFLFFIDCAFSGGGKYLSVGSLSIRMILAGTALVFAIPKLILNIKKYIKNRFFICFLLF